MKKIIVALSFALSLFVTACGSNADTSTDMPDSGYQPRTDATNPNPVTTDALPGGAVGVDSINNGHTNTAGVFNSASNKKQDSVERK